MVDLKQLTEENIDYIQFHFTTIFGDLKSVEFPAGIWEEMAEGTGVDGSSLGFLTTEQSDMRVNPDHDTLAILPWEPRVARLICDIQDNSGTPHPTCPRNILKKVVKDAEKLGYEYKTRPELEWYFVDQDIAPADIGGYMDTTPLDRCASLRRDITDDLLEMGVGLKTIHHENGPAQQEIEFTPEDALRQADNVQTAKLAIKTEAHLMDLTATFMAKPYPDEAGSGMHIHQYITKDGANIFADPETGISETLRHFVGGIMEHVDAMSAILNPTTNSYKRLVPGHEAPVHKSWGVANRTALIRIPGYEKSARVEYRATDCTANIYLASALLLAAGLDGIKKKTEPTPPTTENIEKMTPRRRKELGITQLPMSLEEALDNIEESPFVRDILGPDILDIYVEAKRRECAGHKEAKKAGDGQERQWEYDRYLLRA